MEKLNFATSSLPDATAIPSGYVLHYYTTTCGHCATQSSRSDFYALHLLKSRMDKSLVRHLVKCDRPTYNLPVERIKVGHRNIPYCAECLTIDLTHLPTPTIEDAERNLHNVNTTPTAVKNTESVSPYAPRPAKATPAKATLGDLA